MGRRRFRNRRRNQTKVNTTTNQLQRIRALRGRTAVQAQRRDYTKTNLQVIPSAAVAPSPTGRKTDVRKSPRQKDWSRDNVRLRCKERPKDNSPKGHGGGKKVFKPWC